jgi:uncharacterized protein YdhG (YjbR/CyaY superfamily)
VGEKRLEEVRNNLTARIRSIFSTMGFLDGRLGAMDADYPEHLLSREAAPPYDGEGPLALWHFSEDPSLTRFRPRAPAASGTTAPLVGAVDTRHAPLFWFPGDCPRGCIWPVRIRRAPDTRAARSGVLARQAAGRHNGVVSAQEIDQYLDALEEPKRGTLAQLRQRILDVIPEAEQGMSYGLPAFKIRGQTVAGFAAFKNHLSYLPHSGSVFPQLKDELTGYTTSAGALRFHIDRALPAPLVERLMRYGSGKRSLTELGRCLRAAVTRAALRQER